MSGTSRYVTFLAALSLILLSCDSLFESRIQNDSGKEIIVKVCLTPSSYPRDAQLRNYISNDSHYQGILLIDSTNLKITYNIPDGSSFYVERGLRAPDTSWSDYDSLYIFSADTLALLNAKEIYQAIPKVDDQRWELHIKK